MKILIIEDELPAARHLKNLLEEYDPTFEVLGIIDSNAGIYEWRKKNDWPNLIFSDIELLDGQVFETFRKLEPNAPIIFVTAYDHFMQEAFSANGISYLLKPFNELQLDEALSKFHRLKGGSNQAVIAELMKQLQRQTDLVNYKTRLTVRKGKGIYLLQVADIACLCMRKGILHAFERNGKAHLLSTGLIELQSQLNPRTFFLINRSEGVNVHFIERMEGYGSDRVAVYVTGQIKPLITSAARTPEFRQWLQG